MKIELLTIRPSAINVVIRSIRKSEAKMPQIQILAKSPEQAQVKRYRKMGGKLVILARETEIIDISLTLLLV